MDSFTSLSFAQGLQMLQTSQTGRFLDGSALALYLYDYALTFELERLYVWQAKWTATKMLFLINRYIPLFDLIMTYYRDNGTHMAIHCNKLIRAYAWIYMIGMYTSEIILALRVWAVWKMNKFIVVPSLLFHAISFGVLSAKTDMMIAPLQYFDLPPLTGCLTFLVESDIWIGFVIILINDTAMTALMIIPTLKAYKTTREGLERALGTGLMDVIYREGLLFYIYILVVSIATFIVTVTSPNSVTMFVYLGIARVLRVSLAGRVVLHIRQAYATRGSNNSFSLLSGPSTSSMGSPDSQC